MAKIVATLFFICAIFALRDNLGLCSLLMLHTLGIFIWKYFQEIMLPFMISLFVLFLGIWKYDYGFIILSTGMLLNYAVVLRNNNRMPISRSQFVKKYSLDALPSTYFFSNEHTKLKLLSDRLYFPYAGGIFTVGDVVLWIGYLFTALNHW